MAPEDLDRIETELAVTLPAGYREILRRVEFQGAAAGFEEFSGDADEIVGLNLEVRQDGFFGVKWPRHFLVIGTDGAGNNYFTDLERDVPAVFLADHEQTTKRGRLITAESYASFADFLIFVQRLTVEVASNPIAETEAEETRPPQPWWRWWRR